jgi:hypothetical protein
MAASQMRLGAGAALALLLAVTAAAPLAARGQAPAAQATAQGGAAASQGGGRGAAAAATPIAPQDPKTLKRDAQGHPDFSGMWNNQYTPNLLAAVAGGGELPFTPLGAERWKNVDTRYDPTAYCLPPGPSRLFTSPFPHQVMQSPQVIAVVFEYFTTWRLFYVDGTHPEDLGDYGSEFNGHSTAQWQGDALVVDTIGINPRSWLDTAGHEHSDKLHLTERFEKITDDHVRYTATFDDPVFFTRPWSITRTFTRATAKDRLLPYTCTENNKDVEHLLPAVKAP